MQSQIKKSDIKHCREVVTLAIIRGERSPSEEEARREDWGSPPEGFAWWTDDAEDQATRCGPTLFPSPSALDMC